MQTNNIVEVDGLTATENKVYCLNGVGKQIKEIAEILNSSYETAKSHMKNIKQKLGLQKDKEITAHFWCMLVGKNFDEVIKCCLMPGCWAVMLRWYARLSISFWCSTCNR